MAESLHSVAVTLSHISGEFTMWFMSEKLFVVQRTTS